MEKIITITWPLAPKRIITKEDLFTALKLDPKDWIVHKLTGNKYDVSMKDKDGVHISENIQVKLELTPRVKKELITLKELLEEYTPREYTDSNAALHRSQNAKNDVLWSVMIYDAHIDKLDVKWTSIQKKVAKVLDGTNRILDKLSKFDIDKMLFVNWWDYFNTLTKWATKWNTQQENNCSEKEAWKYWLELQIELLELISKLAPVDAIFIEWNHEAEKLTYLRDAVSAYNRNNPNINILEWNGDRQYYQWWETMMWFTHGDKIKPANLVTVAHQENSRKKYNNLEMFQWHLHKSTKDTFAWAIVEVLTWASWQNDWARWHWYDVAWWQINWYVHSKKEWRQAHIIQKL